MSWSTTKHPKLNLEAKKLSCWKDHSRFKLTQHRYQFHHYNSYTLLVDTVPIKFINSTLFWVKSALHLSKQIQEMFIVWGKFTSQSRRNTQASPSKPILFKRYHLKLLFWEGTCEEIKLWLHWYLVINLFDQTIPKHLSLDSKRNFCDDFQTPPSIEWMVMFYFQFKKYSNIGNNKKQQNLSNATLQPRAPRRQAWRSYPRPSSWSSGTGARLLTSDWCPGGSSCAPERV